jgi:hypothetical protein
MNAYEEERKKRSIFSSTSFIKASYLSPILNFALCEEQQHSKQQEELSFIAKEVEVIYMWFLRKGYDDYIVLMLCVQA